MPVEQSNPFGGLSVRKLHPSLGAEVRGVDFMAPLDAMTVDAIERAWAEHPEVGGDRRNLPGFKHR